MRRQEGFTLVELAIVVAVVAIMVIAALTGMDDWEDAEAARVSARSIEGAFIYARSEAIRTGHNHMVFIEEDTTGAALTAEGGVQVPVLVLDDGLPGSTDQNCLIDAGEPVRGFRLVLNTLFDALLQPLGGFAKLLRAIVRASGRDERFGNVSGRRKEFGELAV